MGILDFLFGRKKEPVVPSTPPTMPHRPLLEPVTIQPGITLPKALADHWPLIAQTRRTSISIKAIQEQPLDIRQSSFGHFPCLPKGYPYPTDPNGNYMYPLAQINFSECPPLPGFPTAGYLHFYVAATDIYGLDFDDQQTQSGFRILFFEADAISDPITDFSFVTESLDLTYAPMETPHRLTFHLQEEYAGMSDYQAGANPANGIIPLAEQYPDIEDELMGALYETFPSNGHKMDGYAYFTQIDPRADNDTWIDYKLLLQIDSDEHIMWGDVGVANFFIHPDDLAKKDFSNVIYNWDCS